MYHLPVTRRDLKLVISAMGAGIPFMEGKDKADARALLKLFVKCLEEMETDNGHEKADPNQ